MRTMLVYLYAGSLPEWSRCDFESGLCSWINFTQADRLRNLSQKKYDPWLRNKGATPTNKTGPDVDHTYDTVDGESCLWLDNKIPVRSTSLQNSTKMFLKNASHQFLSSNWYWYPPATILASKYRKNICNESLACARLKKKFRMRNKHPKLLGLFFKLVRFRSLNLLLLSSAAIQFQKIVALMLLREIGELVDYSSWNPFERRFFCATIWPSTKLESLNMQQPPQDPFLYFNPWQLPRDYHCCKDLLSHRLWENGKH